MRFTAFDVILVIGFVVSVAIMMLTNTGCSRDGVVEEVIQILCAPGETDCYDMDGIWSADATIHITDSNGADETLADKAIFWVATHSQGPAVDWWNVPALSSLDQIVFDLTRAALSTSIGDTETAGFYGYATKEYALIDTHFEWTDEGASVYWVSREWTFENLQAIPPGAAPRPAAGPSFYHRALFRHGPMAPPEIELIHGRVPTE